MMTDMEKHFCITLDDVLIQEGLWNGTTSTALFRKGGKTRDAIRIGKARADTYPSGYLGFIRKSIAVLMQQSAGPRNVVSPRTLFSDAVYLGVRNNNAADLYTDNVELDVEWVRTGAPEELIASWRFGCAFMVGKIRKQQTNGLSVNVVDTMRFHSAHLPAVFLWDFVPFRNDTHCVLQSPLRHVSVPDARKTHKSLLRAVAPNVLRQSKVVMAWVAFAGINSDVARLIIKR